MLPSRVLLQHELYQAIEDKARQGHDISGLHDRLRAASDSYDTLYEIARALADLPLRADWPYVEPTLWDEMEQELAPDRVAQVHVPENAASRIRAAFLGAVCGCTLGKPLEVEATMGQLKNILGTYGQWPLQDYVSQNVRECLPVIHETWSVSVREGIQAVPPDDDLNYRFVNLLVLERHGAGFRHKDLAEAWMKCLPVGWTYGAERARLQEITLGTEPLRDHSNPAPLFRAHTESCGAMIRADVFGYACVGRPALAVRLAAREASFTHRRTGVYAAMFVAAAVALAPLVSDPIELFRQALGFVPQRSRFFESATKCLGIVAEARTFEGAYAEIHRLYRLHGHCEIHQEVGTLMNTVRFASDTGDGICLQVMQGNDTDSFGAIAGSLLGMRFGPEGLDPKWLAPFNDRMILALAGVEDPSLSAMADRMARLPESVAPIPSL